MAKKDFTLTSKILMTLLAVGDIMFVPYKELRRRSYRGQLFGDLSRATSAIYYLHRKGLIRIVDRDNERFVKLTKNGELEALLAKARLPVANQKWDGKWRLIIFDIPEESREKRDLLRLLLKKHGFAKLQASVFINPYPLNREAIDYLKQTGLNQFIRILKVEEIDDDKELRKKFNLVV